MTCSVVTDRETEREREIDLETKHVHTYYKNLWVVSFFLASHWSGGCEGGGHSAVVPAWRGHYGSRHDQKLLGTTHSWSLDGEGSHTFACLFIFHTHGTAVQVVWILQDCMPHPWHNTCSSWCTGRKHVSHWFQHQFPWLSFLLCRSFGCWLHGETSPVLICSFSAAAFSAAFFEFPNKFKLWREESRGGV